MDAEKTGKTCEQRIDQELKSRLEDYLPRVSEWSLLTCARYLKSHGSPIETADLATVREQVVDLVSERASEGLLSVDKSIHYKLCLSWGGPADYFELDWLPDAEEWSGGRYIFQDWFDGATRNLTLEQVEELARVFGIDPKFAFSEK